MSIFKKGWFTLRLFPLYFFYQLIIYSIAGHKANIAKLSAAGRAATFSDTGVREELLKLSNRELNEVRIILVIRIIDFLNTRAIEIVRG